MSVENNVSEVKPEEVTPEELVPEAKQVVELEAEESKIEDVGIEEVKVEETKSEEIKHEDVKLDETDKVVQLSSEEKQWSMFIHLSTFIGFFTGFGFLLAPLILWLIKKDNSEFIDQNGKEAVNFQITVMIYGIVTGLLCFVLIGFLLIPVVALYHIIYSIIGGIKASEGTVYRIPLTIRFIK